MIDAGSSGCRAHVYRYGLLGSEKGSLYIVPQHVSKKVKPGLSSFAKNPTAAGESLTGLIDFLKSAIPPSEWENTPIWLKATAGLRMLQRDESANILMSVREFLGDKSKSPFLFRLSWAKVIPGTEEGAFGWMAVNYLYKVIGPKRVRGREPYAVVEMGGASSQVTQMAPDAREAGLLPADYKFVFTIESEQYSLYTHSYLGYGGEQARESVNKALLPGTDSESEVKDPCLNTGYVREKGQSRRDVYEGPAVPVKVVGVAGGLTNGCFDLASKTLFPAEEQAQSCTSPAPRSFGCVFQPDFVSRAKNFLVFENFFYVASGVGLKPAGHGNPGVSEKTKFPLKTSPQEYLDSSVEVCSTSWSSLATEFPRDAQPKDFNTKMCFATSYAAAFLVNGLGLPREKLITVQKEVAGSEIEWALGAAYKEALDFFGTEKMLRGTGTVATKYS
eukprot:CAMPEP_0182429124 /NCGR_PEP_ID=MMETSP1167-20130531/25532_1 /TAXON_ID=2988 /ORGANISM="Mallomonas Sp, Strain CCMP3275" /LENGTH=445 /DNA_ID=CAMNT_0024612471 /DNA_START=449 /DNA_END=1786 /DNA_ORIENTATION=-